MPYRTADVLSLADQLKRQRAFAAEAQQRAYREAEHARRAADKAAELERQLEETCRRG